MKQKSKHPENKFYVTTPIYYINDAPHIGHAYSTIAADVLARYYRKRLGKENVRFVTGTDENSQKTIDAAKKSNKVVEDYTNKTARKWQAIFDTLGISYDRFIRTTDEDHIATVQDIMQRVFDKGDIYKGIYEGLYCVGHEAFMKEDDLVNGLCPDHGKAPEKIREENYFFKLSRYQGQLRQYITNHPDFIQPASRRNEVLAFIDRGLEDFSISRESQTWGIKLPFDKTQVAYVWFDALLNYVTAAGYGAHEFKKWWPANLHIVGKDIIKFHCIYWPAMLWSAGLELPEKVFAHGFFTIDGVKVSKSLGNAIDPVELANKYGNDALRYFLLREIPFGADGDFSFERFKIVYETELGNKVGNLVARVAAMLDKYCEGKYDTKDLPNTLSLDDYIANLEFEKYLGSIIDRCEELNGLIEATKPWELVKTDPAKVKEVLDSLVSEVLLVADLLVAFLPDTATSIQKTFTGGRVDSSSGILFPRINA